MRYTTTMIIFFIFANLAYGENIPVYKKETLTFPVILEEQRPDEIKSIDMIMSFHPSFFRITQVSLAGGLLEEGYVLTWRVDKNVLNASVIIDDIFLANGTGIVFNITGQVIGDIFQTGQFQIDSFVRNEIQVSAVFVFQNNPYDALSLIATPCDGISNNKIGMEDAIFHFKVLSEIISQDKHHCTITLESLIDILRTLTNNFYAFKNMAQTPVEKNPPRKYHELRAGKERPTLYIENDETIILPVVLDQKMEIWGAHIQVQLNPSVFKINNISLADSILWGQNYRLNYNYVNDNLTILIYAKKYFVNGKGPLVYITLDTTVDKSAIETIEMSRFDCSETNMLDNSGIFFQEALYRSLDISIQHSPEEDNTLENNPQTYTGTISGIVTRSDGTPIHHVSVLVTSKSTGIERAGLSNHLGQFLVSDIKAYQNDVPVDDYIVTVFHQNYPSQSKQYYQDGDFVNFVFSDLCISGSVGDIDGNDIPQGLLVNVLLFEANVQKPPMKQLTESTHPNFEFTGVDSNKRYQLLFHINGTSVKQWAGDNYQGKALHLRHDAALLRAGETVPFQFNDKWLENIE